MVHKLTLFEIVTPASDDDPKTSKELLGWKLVLVVCFVKFVFVKMCNGKTNLRLCGGGDLGGGEVKWLRF